MKRKQLTSIKRQVKGRGRDIKADFRLVKTKGWPTWINAENLLLNCIWGEIWSFAAAKVKPNSGL